MDPPDNGNDSDCTPNDELLNTDEADEAEGDGNLEGETVTTESTDSNTKESAKKTPTKPKRSKEEKAQAKERMLVWARGLQLRDVVLTQNGDDVDTLGPRKWSDLTMQVKEAFMKANNISKYQTLRLASQLGMNVANHINLQGFKDKTRTTLRSTSKSKRAKPDCVTFDGTLYRAINVIILKKDLYIQSKDSIMIEKTRIRGIRSQLLGRLFIC
jgi:hypothetical protein